MKLTSLCLVGTLAFASISSAQEEVKKIDGEFHAVYQQVTGISLAQAIEESKAQDSLGATLTGNVVVRFNGGGANNKLFVGEKNTLEILVKNDAALGGLTLGFKFVCPSSQFTMVSNYGTVPTGGNGPHRVLRLHTEPFGIDTAWSSFAASASTSDSILVGGVDFVGTNRLPPQANPSLLYSVQIELPETAQPVSSGFSVRCIFFPPAGDWTFSEEQDQSTVGYSPHFQGNPNPDGHNPTAPAVSFDIALPTCYQPMPPKDEADPSSNIEGIAEIMRRCVWKYDADGMPLIRCSIKYHGNLQDLRELGVQMDRLAESGFSQSARFRLDLLPIIAALPKLEYIHAPTWYREQLDAGQ